MGKFTKLTLSLLGLLFFAITACDSSEKLKNNDFIYGKNENKSQVQGISLNELIVEIEDVQRAIQQKLVLERSPKNVRANITQLLINLKSGVQGLKRQSTQAVGIRILRDSLNQFKSLPLISADRPHFYSVLDKISYLLHELTGDADAWKLFEYRFDRGIAPFLSFSTAGEANDWVTDWSLDRSFAVVKSRFAGDVQTWLLSPSLDLSLVKNPAFRVLHGIGMNSSDRSRIPLDRIKILNSAFKAYVSVDYQSGEPNLKGQWQEIDLRPLPSSYDFHESYSPEISLEKYRSKNVTIALVYNQKADIIGNHFISWQVQKFELLGAGFLPKIKERTKETEPKNDFLIFNHDFSAKGLENFEQVAITEPAAVWASGTGNGDSFVTISGFKEKLLGRQLLMTAPIDLAGHIEAQMSLNHAINFYTPKGISEKYLVTMVAEWLEGFDAKTAKWTPLEFKQWPNETSRWTVVESEFLTLPADLQGKKIVIGFEYRGAEGDFPNWRLYRMRLRRTPAP